MIRSLKFICLFSLVMGTSQWVLAASAKAQVVMSNTPLPFASSTMGDNCYGCSRGPVVVPMQMTYAAFFAPQVPVVPMAYGPVPTVSAYYVPTVPVAQTVFVPVVPVHKWRHHHKKARVWVSPVAIHPVYWMPY